MAKSQSSFIKSITYNDATSALEVDLMVGGKYKYQGVPKYIYTDFLKAESRGRFFVQNIKNKYVADKA